MKYYLSGPMTGLPEMNYPLFIEVAGHLRLAGHTVYNPAEWEQMNAVDGVPAAFDLRQAFADYCTYLCQEADAIMMLPGWQNSPGARAEIALSQAIGLPVVFWDVTLDQALDQAISLHVT